MNKSCCDEISENLFVTECIFVGYTIREIRGIQIMAFFEVT